MPMQIFLTGTDNGADSMALSIPLCDGQTLFRNITCGLSIDPTTTNPPTLPTTDAISSELLIVATIVPVLVVLLILVCVMALIMVYLVWSIHASKKRPHSFCTGTYVQYVHVCVYMYEHMHIKIVHSCVYMCMCECVCA